MDALFQVHRLNEEGLAKADRIAKSFDQLLNSLQTDIVNCREMSIVKTKLEEACFFAKKAMANDPNNQF